MTKELFIKQLDLIISSYNSLKSISKYDDFSGVEIIDKVSALIASAKAAIVRITGVKSEYYKAIEKCYEDKQNLSYDGLRLIHIMGVVSALKDDLANDFLKTMHELVHAEIFSDYLEMSDYLISEGYKDSAAVIAGSTLESHLRELCKKYEIEIEHSLKDGKILFKKADTMNIDLCKSEIYNKTYQKQITAWLDIRNNAAHGKYAEYKEDDVNLMIKGIRTFMINYIA